MTPHRTFQRSFGSLQQIVEFTAEFFARHAIDRRLLPTVDLALEELFTNMVKYGPAGEAQVRIEMAAVPGGIEVALTDHDVDRFDVTQAPDPEVDLPLEQRQPGGLGLHLVRHLVDALQYEYSSASRQSRITFRKTLPS